MQEKSPHFYGFLSTYVIFRYDYLGAFIQTIQLYKYKKFKKDMFLLLRWSMMWYWPTCKAVLHISYHILTCHVTSCHVMSRHVTSCHVMSCHVMSCHVISYHIISCHVMSYHIISYHVISYHIISYIISYIIYHIII